MNKDKVISELQAQIASMKRGGKSAISGMEARLAQLDKEKAALAERRSTTKHDNDAKIDELQNELSSLRSKEQELSNELQSKEQKFEQLKQENEVKISEIGHITE
jgi:chromosome segregation ATPase